MTGQIHAPTVLLLRKNSQYSQNKSLSGSRRGSERFFRENFFFASAENETPNLPAGCLATTLTEVLSPLHCSYGEIRSENNVKCACFIDGLCLLHESTSVVVVL